MTQSLETILPSNRVFFLEGRSVFIKKNHDFIWEVFRYPNNLLGVVRPDNLNLVFVKTPFRSLGINCCFFIFFRKGLSAWFVSKISEVGIDQSLDVRVCRVPRVERLKIPVLFFNKSVNRLSKEVMVIICKGLKKVEKASHGGKRP